MSVSKVNASRAVTATVGAVRGGDSARDSSQQSSQREQPSSDDSAPPARRYPWLSWETRELEAASKQPSPYGHIPYLGSQIDQSA